MPHPLTTTCLPDWSSSFGGSSGANSNVFALAVFDDGNGPALYAGGAFSSVGGVPANGVARWSGASWSVLGSGVSGGYVAGLTVFDDGGGSALYACGSFTDAGGVATDRIARWDGAGWSALAGGWSSGSPLLVSSLEVFDAGTGRALHAAGTLQNMGGPPSSFVARWDGSNWSLLTDPADAGESVLALAVGDLGSGPALYAGGDFFTVGGVSASGIAMWNGSSWSPLAGGMSSPWEPPVKTIKFFDDGTGPALYAAGAFATAGATPANNIARWDGTQWTALGSGTGPAVFALASYDHGSGPALFAAGTFTSAGGTPSNYIAEWSLPPGCAQPAVVVCVPGLAGTIACPCGNPPVGLDRGCNNSAATGGARLDASGTASLANDSLVFTCSGETPNVSSCLLQGTALMPGGAVFGQGVRCTSGLLRRLYYQGPAGGSITFPGTGAPSVSARSASLGDVIAQGTHRYYAVYYRDPIVLGGCPAASAFNITQQLDVLWHP